MESDIHDSYTCSGNGWSSCKNLNAPPLDFQGFMSISREHHLAPSTNKDSAPAYNPFMALSYSQDSVYRHPHHHHHLHHQHPASGRELWQSQGQLSEKTKSDAEPPCSFSTPSARKPCDSKHFHASVSGDLQLQQNPTYFPPFEIPTQQNHAFFSPFEDHVGSCNEMDQNIQPSSTAGNLISNRKAMFKNNSPVMRSKRKWRKNPLPKKRVKCYEKDLEVKKKKRCRNEESWSRNLRKNARAKGETYVSVVGKTVPARSVKSVDCSKCKFQCQSRITQEDRQKLFNSYWSLETFKEKVDFICTSVQEFVPLRPKSGKRAVSRRYKLHVNGKEERVCKEFFTSTFDVHESTIGTYMNKKRKNSDSDTIQDLRGKRAPSNKTPDSVLRKVREHILSQIGLQSSLDKAPSEEAKNVKQLYTSYVVECSEENVKPAGVSVYRKVFNELHKGKNAKPITLPPVEDFNQGVKKSQCNLGSTLEVTDTTETSSASATASDVAQSIFPNSSVLYGTMNVLAPNQIDNPSQQTETSSTAVTSFGAIKKDGTSPCINQKFPSFAPNLSVSSTRHSHHSDLCIESQDVMQHGGSLELSVFHRQNSHSSTSTFFHQPVNASETSAHKDGRDSSHHGKDQPVALNVSSLSENSTKNSHSHSQSTSQNFPASGNCRSSQDTCCENENPQLILPKHICSLQDKEDLIAPETSETALSKSSDNRRSKMCSGDERTSTDVKKASGGMKKDIGISLNKSRALNEVKKRQRNEEQWARNIRKRLRFKGEEYTSVTGKKVGARKVQAVDCSKCKFKCPTKVSEEQREQINSFYWGLDSYERKVAFIAKHVQTYQPKRKMTGRRAFSRNYTLEVDQKEVRVCKDFFQATLHIGQSTITTYLEKTRKGPDAVKELRGKRSPVNKTPDAIVRDICELIIFVTGLRPHRIHENKGLGHNVKSLYQAYVYDAELKGNKVASIGVFRSVLLKEFGLTGMSKIKKEQGIIKSSSSILK